jgi:hypothetical protein
LDRAKRIGEIARDETDFASRAFGFPLALFGDFHELVVILEEMKVSFIFVVIGIEEHIHRIMTDDFFVRRARINQRELLSAMLYIKASLRCEKA